MKPRFLQPLLFLSLIIVAACTRSGFRTSDGLIWNTSYHITYEGKPELEDSIISVLNEVGKSLNVFDSTSLVSRINLTDTIVVDRHFISVYNTSRSIKSRSNGMFDPTLSPLIDAWGFGRGHTPTADTARLAEIIPYVGLWKTYLRGDTLIKEDPRINFNFSAVAKGYACDEVAAMLKRNRVSNYLVEIGGEIAVGGVSPKSDLWKISIDRPLQRDSSVNHDSAAVIRIKDAGIATSGNYRNFRHEGNSTFGHTLSPVTGRPVTTDVISASVIAPNAMMADAAATACMAAGSEVAKNMINDLNYEAYLILADSTIWTTPGIERLLQ